MSKKNIIVFGTGKIADIVYNGICEDPDSEVRVVAFCIDSKYYERDYKEGLPVVKFEEVKCLYPPDEVAFFVAIGYHEMNKVREQRCLEVVGQGYELISFVDSRANISSTAKIGKNVLIMNGVDIGPFSDIGDNVCIYSGAIVSHHAKVKNNVWITSGTVIGGNSVVGSNCFLGINSTVGHNITIGDNNFLGANAVVTKNTANDSVYIVPDTPKYRLNTAQFMKLFKFD